MQRPVLKGVIPANILPFKEDFSIDEPAYRRHLEWLVQAGVDGITCNGHAAEVSSLSRTERRRALEIAVDQVAGRVPVIAGIDADGTHEAISLAQEAKEVGASAILVFPSNTFVLGFERRPEMVYEHFARIAEAVDLPIVVFRYPRRTGLFYDTDLLVRLASIDNVVAVKDWGLDIVALEEAVRALHSLPRPVSVLSSISKQLLSTLLLGADGILSGNGSVIADLHIALFRAVQQGDLKTALEVNDRLFPLTQAFYDEPLLDQYTRMKEALVLLGRLERAVVRPPLLPIPPEERERLRQALVQARLLPVPV